MTSSFRQRYAAARNRQATDWWTATFADPVSWVVLGLTADWPLLTPHRITLVSFVFKLAPAALLISGSAYAALWSAVLLQLGQVLDSMDGNLARYRGVSSRSGGFLDKILDGAGFVAVMSALSWYVFKQGGREYYLLLGPLAAALYLLVCYMHWTSAFLRQQDAAGKTPGTPNRDPRLLKISTWRYIVVAQRKVLQFKQADFYFWIGLALVLNRPEAAVWLLLAVNGKTALERFFSRYRSLLRLDKRTGLYGS